MIQPDNLKVCSIQANLIWEDKNKNLSNFNTFFAKIIPGQDIIVLPEMFTTGFSMNAEAISEMENGPTMDWIKNMAMKLGSMIIGSYAVNESGNFYNRLFAVFPDGEYLKYDKRHLFRIEGESDVYTPGKSKLIFDYKGWKISTFICYDLRFPVWSRNRKDYDLYINVANWPGSRSEIWTGLLKARAIENQVYAIGVNRVGFDNSGTAHSGDSLIIDPKGQILSYAKSGKEEIIYAELSLTELKNFRKKFPVSLDADEFTLHLK